MNQQRLSWNIVLKKVGTGVSERFVLQSSNYISRIYRESDPWWTSQDIFIDPGWTSQDIVEDKSTLPQVISWCGEPILTKSHDITY